MNDKNWETLEPTFSLEEDRLRILKQALPEAFTDGKINFDTLKELLGEAVADDEQDEHFGLSWTGKREARKLAGMPSKGTLLPIKGKGLHEDTTENIFIEGDNLEVLKLLHKSYYGKIKMIYIDPPYNTGNDFIYKDDYKMPLESYLLRSGQMNEMDEMLTSNPKSSGRFHSDWLNMIYPRLRVAKDLLRDDGVIFVSIDDNEVHNLRQTMNEIFGEENFVSNIVWEKKYAKQNDATWFSTSHDHILLFARNKDSWRPNKFERSAEQLKGYSNPDNDARGNWQSVVYTCNKTRLERPNLYYGIPHPKTGKEVFPDETRVWGCDKNKNLQHIKENRLWWGKDFEKDKPRLKVFLNEVGTGIVPDTLWLRSDAGDNQDAKKAILDLFGVSVFDTPKPTKLVKKMLEVSTSNESKDLILDFFSGSGTTAQAAMESNKDGGKRKFICIQVDEKIKGDSDAFKANFRTISEITVERIRRASKKIEKELAAGLPLEQKPDLGFKFYRLERSNFKAWSDYQGTNLDELRGLLQAQVSTSFVPYSTKEGILTEILLLEGFPLDSDISQDETFERNTVWRVSSEFSEHRLFVTLDEEIWEETITNVEELEPNDIFICLDKALSDESKIRMSDVCRLKVI
jgi:adenine-specific DNA-methyltransferase